MLESERSERPETRVEGPSGPNKLFVKNKKLGLSGTGGAVHGELSGQW